jgi:hypothetical protein
MKKDRDEEVLILLEIEKFIKNRHKTRPRRSKVRKGWSVVYFRKAITDHIETFAHIWRSIRLNVNLVLGDMSDQIRAYQYLEEEAARLWQAGFPHKSLIAYLKMLERRKRSYEAIALIPLAIVFITYWFSIEASATLTSLEVTGSIYIIWTAACRADNNKRIDVVSMAIELGEECKPY